MAFLTARHIVPERMDEADVPEADLRASLRFIRFVNRWLGGAGVVIGHLDRWASSWPTEQTIRILDLATGSADIPLAIVRWAAGRGHRVQVIGLDRHPTTLRLAAEHLATHGDPPNITLLRGDALDPPLRPNAVDYCISSMFLHHLPDLEVMTALKVMDELAVRGIVWNDLCRTRLGRLGARLLSLPCRPIVRHDAVTSVGAGFTRAEVVDFRNRLDLTYTRYRRHLWERFTLAGDRTL